MPQERGVQSVARTFAVLDTLADAGGQSGLTDIAARTGLAESTTHRLVSTLVDLGVLRREAGRRYGLSARLVRLGAAATPGLGAAARPVLADLVDALGESANLAMLVGDQAEYIAQVPSRHAMRMFTEVGRSTDLHCTGVGKAMLSTLDPARAQELLRRRGMPPRTPHTITDIDVMAAELERTRERGWCLDEQEQEVGVRCIAAPLPIAGDAVFAVSISGPLPRMTDDLIARAAPLLLAAARELTPILSA